MPRILLAALVGLAVLVVPAIAAGDSSKSSSPDVRIVRQAGPNAVLPVQRGQDSAKPAGVAEKTTAAAKKDEPGSVSNDDVSSDSVGDVPATLNDRQEDVDDADDGPVNDVDDGDVEDVDDKAVNDVDDGNVDDVDDNDVDNVDEGDLDDVDDEDVDDVDDNDVDDVDDEDVDNKDDGNIED